MRRHVVCFERIYVQNSRQASEQMFRYAILAQTEPNFIAVGAQLNEFKSSVAVLCNGCFRLVDAG